MLRPKVSYLKSKNIDSSYQNRKKLAEQNGIKDYKGTAKQNELLLSLFKKTTSSKTESDKESSQSKGNLKITTTKDFLNNGTMDSLDKGFATKASVEDVSKYLQKIGYTDKGGGLFENAKQWVKISKDLSTGLTLLSEGALNLSSSIKTTNDEISELGNVGNATKSVELSNATNGNSRRESEHFVISKAKKLFGVDEYDARKMMKLVATGSEFKTLGEKEFLNLRILNNRINKLYILLMP